MNSSGSPLRSVTERYRTGLTLTMFLVVASVMILFTGTPGVAKPQEIGLSVLGFFQGIVSETLYTVGKVGGSVVDLTNLKAQYDKAEALVKKYEGNERTLIQLREENQRLREQLSFHQSLPYFNVPVEVVGKDPTKVYSTLIVNKGFLDGLRKNMPVVATQNGITGLVGKISTVGLSTSIVQFWTPIFSSQHGLRTPGTKALLQEKETMKKRFLWHTSRKKLKRRSIKETSWSPLGSIPSIQPTF